MKRTAILITLILVSISVKAQSISNNISGYFKSSGKDVLYESVYLDGKGHALINDSFPAEYFQKDDFLYVFPDKSVFIFKLDKDKLKGISDWVNKQTFKSTAIPTNDEYERVFETYTVDPNLLYQFYKNNFKEGTDQVSYDAFENEENYIKNMQELCNKELTSACGALFGMKFIQASGSLDSILSGNLTEFEPNKDLETIANKMITLKDNRGYSLLGSYFYAVGDIEKAKEIYTKGAENGDSQSALVLFGLEIEEESNNIETTEQ